MNDSPSMKIMRFGNRTLVRIFPRSRFGDIAFSWLYFVAKHRRFPSNRMLFNDVLYRIKTSDEMLDPLRVFVSDKEYLKLYVRAVVGDKYNVPTIRVLKSEEEIDEYQFPNDCCIKPTHGSGRVILRKGGSSLNLREIKEWFHLNHYNVSREINYKYLKPKVIVEEIVFGNYGLEDYRFFCFNGKAKLIQVELDRHINHTRKHFDREWNELDFSVNYERNERDFRRPENLDEMLRVAEELSRNFTFVRIDLYSNGTHCVVGEITNCAANAAAIFRPPSAEKFASGIVFG